MDELKRLYYLNETIVRFIILNAEEVGPLNPARPLRLGATTSPLSPTPTPAVSVTSEGA
ncbi:MAG: hypothetical protein HYU33_02290 [Candidatus Omnitrophica bacterium]|nr:hypothetical protein [Candidatus Omnitrophota bacterium]